MVSVGDSDLERRTRREFFEMSSRLKKQNRRVTDLRWKKRGQIMLSEAP